MVLLARQKDNILMIVTNELTGYVIIIKDQDNQRKTFFEKAVAFF